MAPSKRTRFEVLRRDDHRCRYCGATAADGARLTVDHVTPTALGGTDDPSNLVAACVDCNAGKTSTNPDGAVVAQVAEDAVRWAGAIAQAAREVAADRRTREAITEAVDAAWTDWKDGRGRALPRPQDWRASVEQFAASGLSAAEMFDLVQVAMNSKAGDPWRYFCGCCWKRIGQLQDRAKEIVGLAQPHECHCEGVEPETPHPHRSPEQCGTFMEGVWAGRRAARNEVDLEAGRADWHLEQVVDHGYLATAALAVECGRSNLSSVWAA